MQAMYVTYLSICSDSTPLPQMSVGLSKWCVSRVARTLAVDFKGIA